jgi:hypothetical protein
MLAIHGKTNRRVERRKSATTVVAIHFQNSVRDLGERKFSVRMRPRVARDLVCGFISLCALDSIVKR